MTTHAKYNIIIIKQSIYNITMDMLGVTYNLDTIVKEAFAYKHSV